jgi:predicted DNA-binding transcriptional regulator YafY
MPQKQGDDSRDTMLRQWTTLRMIPRQPQQLTTRQVWERLGAQGYEVTLRTVQRDLNTLQSKFHFQFAPGSGPEAAVWFWPQNKASLDIPGLEPSTAIALLLSRKHLEQILPKATLGELTPYFSRAEAVLAEQHTNVLSTWRHKVRVLHRGPRLSLPPVKPAAQLEVYEALLRSRQIEALYRGRGAVEAKTINLNPLGIVVKDAVTYLVATSWDYPDVRHYALHRFESVTILDQGAKVPEDFDLGGYIENENTFGYGESSEEISLELQVESNVAVHLSERTLSSDQRIEELPEGRSRVTATVADTAELRWWIMGFGPQIEVVKPAGLRKEFAKTAAAMSAIYKPAASAK